MGDEQHLERVTQTFDYGLKAQEPSGYFHYAIHANGSVTFRDPGPDMNMARTSGDMLFWMIKQFQLLKAQGRGQAIKPEWEASMKKLADAMVATWKKRRPVGQADQRQDRRRRRIQHHRRRHDHRRAGPGVRLFPKSRIPRGRARKPPTFTTPATS